MHAKRMNYNWHMQEVGEAKFGSQVKTKKKKKKVISYY